VARANVANAGLSERVNVLVGPAAQSLASLSTEDKFDLAFIDADDESKTLYVQEAKRLVRKGGVIVRRFLASLSVWAEKRLFRSLTMSYGTLLPTKI
jgi:tRNA A58 N-methylase Trm61